MEFLPYSSTPIQAISNPILLSAGVRLLVKREDLNHTYVSGNKWWKLKYNILHALENGFSQLLTFGGPYSNHLYSTSAASRLLGLKSIGIVRGERVSPLNNTLTFAESNHMLLHFVSREDYRRKSDPSFTDELLSLYGDFYHIPEGGTNSLAIRGVIEFAQLLDPVSADYIALPVGTAGTLTGLAAGLSGKKKILGISVLKGDFHRNEVARLAQEANVTPRVDWEILTGYHHGGYAKTSRELLSFIEEMKSESDLPLDQVYTGKMMYALFEEIKKGVFPRGATILAIHTGGMQGALQPD